MTDIRIKEKVWMSIQHELQDTKQEFDNFRQEVSDVVVAHKQAYGIEEREITYARLSRFIIPKPKPDPLVEVCKAIGVGHSNTRVVADRIHAALDALGFEIREKNDD